MTTQKLFIIAALCSTLFTACKKKDSGDENNPVVQEDALSQIATQLNLLEQAAVKYNENQDTLNNTLHSIINMAEWLLLQPEVEKAFVIDESIIYVHFKSGLKSSISVIPVDASGQHLTRGGGSLNKPSLGKKSKTIALKKFGSTNKITGGSQTIGNDKVLIFAPYVSQFYGGNYPFLPKFLQGPVPLTAVLKPGVDADLACIDLFSDYGFIIINTHGHPNGFNILTKIADMDVPIPPGSVPYSKDRLLQLFSQANNLPLDKIMNGQLEIDMFILQSSNTFGSLINFSVKVTDKYIRAIQHLDDAVVMGNYCYSGYTIEGISTNNMPEAFKSIGAITYYGYAFGNGQSAPVLDSMAKVMEDSLITNLVINDDSTGIAHLINNITEQEQPNTVIRSGGVKVPLEGSTTGGYITKYTTEHPRIYLPLTFKHYFDPRYGYGCGDTITDVRDQQKYPTVCIGDQVWLAKNLNWAGAGVCYDNNGANCATYGRLYTLDELTAFNTSTDSTIVKGLCPDGFHVPSKDEWDELVNFCGGSTAAIDKLRATSAWPTPNQHTNDFDFNLLPAGHFVQGSTSSMFQYLGLGNYHWTSSAIAPYYYAVNGVVAGTYSPPPQITWKFSCRCVMD